MKPESRSTTQTSHDRNMTPAGRRSRGGHRGTLLTLALALCAGTVIGQLRPDYSDLPGKYCEKRRENSRCCANRTDECSVAILGTVCYCDEFCDRGLSGDCCPDYFALCQSAPPPPPATRDCLYKGQTLPYGTTVMDNCNPCACGGSAAAPTVQCGSETCLMEPRLLLQLEGEAEQLGWTAANHSQFWGRTLRSGLLQLTGTVSPDRQTVALTHPIVKVLHAVRLPAAFDARRRPGWAPLVGGVADQGWCGGSWAVSTADVASDRLSIQRGERVALSPQQLLNCVTDTEGGGGCRGGRPDRAWNHLRHHGVRSTLCVPYRSGQTGRRGRCDRRASSNRTVCARRYWMQPSYRIASRERDIRHEILTSGPVQALLRVEPDFFLYRSGVYRASRLGEARAAYHSVRLIGWGEQVTAGRVTPYWLAANSWGTGWGERGLFRIRRGTNEAAIESFVVASLARTERQAAADDRQLAVERRKSDRGPATSPGSLRERLDGAEDRAVDVSKKGISDDVEASGDILMDSDGVTSAATYLPAIADGETTEYPAASELITSDNVTTLGSELLSEEHLVEAEGEKANDLLKSADQKEHLEEQAGSPVPVDKEKIDVPQMPELKETNIAKGTDLEQTIPAVADMPVTLVENFSDNVATVVSAAPKSVSEDPVTTLAEPPVTDISPFGSSPATVGARTGRPGPALVGKRGEDPRTPAAKPHTEGPVTQSGADRKVGTTSEPGGFFSKFWDWTTGQG
ncbi:uncharacterized peptidase C1-like protein F26E4.3 [Amphibalanus amphitrite]|uniref:uncharacterized peptidase C1-like protein F26E4.3 n=1 Tax=Amphibalanus amphitrite TaxID=1232801 RepID=UPI001C924239|nr:uncharacterized peptidase C1-like protein F26E4.3 [Amphibalanus amphitrite]